jgi:hypothetical protein
MKFLPHQSLIQHLLNQFLLYSLIQAPSSSSLLQYSKANKLFMIVWLEVAVFKEEGSYFSKCFGSQENLFLSQSLL